MTFARRFLLIIALILASCNPLAAEPVSVNRGSGLGYVFTHNGNCFLVLPAHVHGRGSRVSIATTAPSAVGDATLLRSFAPELDLSLFYVAPGLQSRCQDRFDRLPEDLGALLDGAVTAQLHRVDATGSETRATMDLTAIDFDTIAATARDTEIYQGTSGAILRIGNTPVGMAIQSENVEQASFLRMDEIVARIRRIVMPNRVPEAAEAPAPSGQCPAGRHAIARVSCDIEPLAPEFACSNLATPGAGPAIFPAGSTPRLEIELAPGAVPLAAVTATAATGQAYAVPKAIAVETSSSSGAPRWLRYGGGDMSPAGTLTVANGAGPFANRIKLQITSSWDAEAPIGLDCLAFN